MPYSAVLARIFAFNKTYLPRNRVPVFRVNALKHSALCFSVLIVTFFVQEFISWRGIRFLYIRNSYFLFTAFCPFVLCMKTFTVSLRRLRVFAPVLPLAEHLCNYSKSDELSLTNEDILLLIAHGVSLSFIQGFPCAECTLRKEGRALQARIDDFKQRQYEQRLRAVLFYNNISSLCETKKQSPLLALQ